MAKSLKRLEAIKLRRSGIAINIIAKRLKVSKSSVSIWCRDIVLSEQQREKLRQSQIAAGGRGRMIGAEMNRQKRLGQILHYEEEGKRVIGKLSERDKFMIGLGLYWGEGVRAFNSTTAIVNSDPSITLFGLQWFIDILGVRKEDIRPYIYISGAHKFRASEIVGFWSKLLNIPKHQFPALIFIKSRSKKVYENHNSYYGVIALRVRRGTSLKYKILGLIKACKEDAGVAQVVRAWHS
jgi:hypothetical protein